MDSLTTEINRINRFPLFSVTEINRSPYGGVTDSVISTGILKLLTLSTGKKYENKS